MEMIGFQARQMPLGFCVMPTYPYLITCDIFERNASFITSQPSKFWHVVTQLSFCSALGRQDKNFGCNPMHFQTVCKKAKD
jgi:hypothetical protein